MRATRKGEGGGGLKRLYGGITWLCLLFDCWGGGEEGGADRAIRAAESELTALKRRIFFKQLSLSRSLTLVFRFILYSTIFFRGCIIQSARRARCTRTRWKSRRCCCCGALCKRGEWLKIDVRKDPTTLYHSIFCLAQVTFLFLCCIIFISHRAIHIRARDLSYIYSLYIACLFSSEYAYIYMYINISTPPRHEKLTLTHRFCSCGACGGKAIYCWHTFHLRLHRAPSPPLVVGFDGNSNCDVVAQNYYCKQLIFMPQKNSLYTYT